MNKKLRKGLEEWPKKTRSVRMELNRKRSTSLAPQVLSDEDKRRLGIKRSKK